MYENVMYENGNTLFYDDVSIWVSRKRLTIYHMKKLHKTTTISRYKKPFHSVDKR